MPHKQGHSEGVRMPVWGQWLLGLFVAAGIVAAPAARFRNEYANYKRLREVTPNRFYRSGQMTAGGFREAHRQYRFKTVINLQEENNDPFMPEAWLGKPSIRESALCEELGVTYYALDGDEITPPDAFRAGGRPKLIDQYLKLLDDPANYPILLHCKAGLHRTGLLTAIYRMEYEGWDKARAVEELRANNFGTHAATTGNVYIAQYIFAYTPKERRPVPSAVPGRPLVLTEGRR
jgi:tyrosine-protein phosphatase SIW14